ncbi:MAG: hypothetical protein GW946_03790 [Candidatus Pacebacteria bacterium]|nr:hypothetical protein [Candidatus Paceibacterota bacterium]PIR60421.1 MAG: hypothetical protein COU67_02205 [Candidatus Pacebacteria bacterium CG10_big_fil_rev_8_21_14_0_10_44_54]
MQSPFRNCDKTVERASRIFPALFLLLFMLIVVTVYVGWKTGEIQKRIIEPVQAFRAHSISQLAREKEAEFVAKRKKALTAESLLREFKEAQENDTNTVTTTTVHSYISPSAPPPSNKTTTNFEFSQTNPSYEPPDWFKERSAQSRAEFEAKSAQSKAEFEAFSAQSKADFEKSKAESQAKIDAWKAENGF